CAVGGSAGRADARERAGSSFLTYYQRARKHDFVRVVAIDGDSGGMMWGFGGEGDLTAIVPRGTIAVVVEYPFYFPSILRTWRKGIAMRCYFCGGRLR